MNRIFVSCLFCVLSAASAPAIDQLPFTFEPNAGQFPAGVKFGSKNPNHAVLLTANSAVLSIRGAGKPVRFTLPGSNNTPEFEALEPTGSSSNHLIGNRRGRWRTNVPQFARVRYRDIYPGIDLVYYGNGRKLEFDFLVKAGADPRRIRMRFSGAEEIRLDQSGDLVMRAGRAELRQARPVVYQNGAAGRVAVDGRYFMAGRNEIGFALGAYDTAKPLVIDPVVYSTYLGGDSAEALTAVAVDRNGRVWMAGYTWSSGIATEGSFRDTRAGGQDVFVARFDTSESGDLRLAYVTYLGGSGNEEPKAMVLDAAGQVYLTGTTSSNDFPLGGNAHQTSNKGDRDAFVAKLNPNESGDAILSYSSYFGGPLMDVATSIAVDAAQNIYIAGYTSSVDNFPLSPATLQGSNRGGWDAFVAKFDTSLSATEALRYSTFLGGGSTDVATGVAVDAAGSILVTGNTYSYDFPIAGSAFRGDTAGGGDIFIARIDPARPSLDALTYGTYFGGTNYDVAYGLLLDRAGRLILSGYTFSTDLPMSGDSLQRENAGSTDLFIAVFDLTRPLRESLVYSTYLGGGDTDVAYGLALDGAGRVLVTGYSVSKDFPHTANAVQLENRGAIDAVLAIVDSAAPAGSGLVYSTYLGGAGIDVAYGVAADAAGNAIVAGTTGTRAFPTVDSAWKKYAEGISEGFLSIVNPRAPAGQ